MVKKNDKRIAFIEESKLHKENIERLYKVYEKRVNEMREHFSERVGDRLKEFGESTGLKKRAQKRFSKRHEGNYFRSLCRSGELYWPSFELNNVLFYDSTTDLLSDNANSSFPIVVGSSNLIHFLIKDVKDTHRKTFFLVYGPTFVRDLDWTVDVDGHVKRSTGLEVPKEESFDDLEDMPVRNLFSGYYDSIMKVFTCPDIAKYAWGRKYEELDEVFHRKGEVEFFAGDRR